MNVIQKNIHLTTVCIALFAVLLLSGCSEKYKESMISENKIQVSEGSFSETYDVSDLTGLKIADIAHHYRRYGGDGVHVTVTYDPRSRVSTASKASGELGRILQEFKKQAMSNVSGDILPVKNSAGKSQALVVYKTYTAHAPEDCELMQGIETNVAAVKEDYRMGCSIDIMMSRQVARPKDLLGAGETPAGIARREGALVEGHMSGVIPDGLDGESVSGE